MKSIRLALQLVAVAAALLLIGRGAPRAEVAVESWNSGTSVLVLGVIEGPDPVPQVIWQPIRDIDVSLVLNPDGASRDDGRPSIAFDGDFPVVVWAFDVGGTHDVALSAWDGARWTAHEFVAAGSEDEDQVDPSLFVEADGTMHVAWWAPAPGEGRVWRTSGTRGNWAAPELVTESGRRPTVAIHEGQRIVAFERNNGAGGQDIVVAAAPAAGGGAYAESVPTTVATLDPLDAVLAVEQGRMWLTWMESDTQYGYAEFSGGAWQPVATVSWEGPSWFGQEQAREQIRDLILTP